MNSRVKKFDVVVIGGGPAGMMAAIRASERGVRVLLLEKNDAPGRKLLLTGNGRCNITQKNFTNNEFIEKIGKKGKFLFSALNSFGPDDVIEFFEKKGVKTKIENDGRVFPLSDSSRDVLSALVDNLKKNGVKILTGTRVENFVLKEKVIEKIILSSGDEIEAKNFLIATGGKSYPTTGSSGDGYVWARKMGHNIIEPSPALAPIRLQEDWIGELQGLGFENVRMDVFQNNTKVDSETGKMIFTHFGISGPVVLNASKKIGELLKNGKVEIHIDFLPTVDFPVFKEKLQKYFDANPEKSVAGYVSEIVPKRMADTILKVFGVDSKKKLRAVSWDESKKIVNILKDLKLEVDGLLGFENAIVTVGGVDLKEVDSKTMKSKIIDNLYFAGEILDLDAPTGGYNLQICWSTGYAAGSSI